MTPADGYVGLKVLARLRRAIERRNARRVGVGK